MKYGNEAFRKQLTAAYKAARKVVTTKEIEIDLINKAKAGSNVAREYIFNLYIPMVISFAFSRQYCMYEGELGDLLSAAALGFNRALELYDSNSNLEFGCYFKYHAFNRMNKELYGDNGVHVPENLCKQNVKKMMETQGKVSELDENGKPQKVVTMISIDTPVRTDDENAHTMLDCLADSSGDLRNVAESEEREKVIDGILNSLPAIESDAVRSMVMEDKEVAETTREFGDRYGFSHEWARKIKNRALKRIRQRLEAISVDESIAV